MTRILCVTDWYLPAYKAGGPVRSVSNLISALAGAEFEFYVLTRDRDLGERSPHAGVTLEAWTTRGQAHVFYTADHSLSNFRRRIKEIKPDIIYLNSFFSTFARRALLLRRLHLIGSSVVVVAPRGELSPGALQLKWPKKKFYIRVAAAIGLCRNLLWHATAELEKSEIVSLLTKYNLEKGSREEISGRVHVAFNIPSVGSDASAKRSVQKKAGQVSFLFISRISPKKNLAFALELLASVRGEVNFDIYGPVDDPGYWRTCEAVIARLPANVKIRYLGPLPHHEVQQKFSQYHFFLFPTLGENFGHAIAESLSAGCPVLISDATPWRDLERKSVGWDLPLDGSDGWLRVLQQCIDLDDEAYRAMPAACEGYFREWARSPAIRQENVELFRRALGQSSGKAGLKHDFTSTSG
jgi:glycosyltransferase involved in cell wall biosynthesis